MSVQDEVLDKHAREFARLVEAVLQPVHADIRILIGHVLALGKRMDASEARLTAIERQVGLNGGLLPADTEPAPPTQPENERPEEPGA